ERGRDRLEVAHFSDEQDVRVLAERGAQALGERPCVGADLALVDDTLLMLVEELDRILDRHDVLGARPVDLVDKRSERRRLTRTGRPGDEDEAARLLGERVEHRRQTELVEGADLARDETERRPDRAALEEGVNAEARNARQ